MSCWENKITQYACCIVFLLCALRATAELGFEEDFCYRNSEDAYVGSKRYPTETTLCNGREAIVDSRIPADTEEQQCRTACSKYSLEGIEVYQLDANCPLCDTYAEVEPFLSDDDVCVPLEKCESECGPVAEGCIYSGSCLSLICFRTTEKLSLNEDGTVSDDGSGTTTVDPGTPAKISTSSDGDVVVSFSQNQVSSVDGGSETTNVDTAVETDGSGDGEEGENSSTKIIAAVVSTVAGLVLAIAVTLVAKRMEWLCFRGKGKDSESISQA